MLKIKYLITHDLASLCILATLILTFIIYSPGLTGGFLFDDYDNLSNLGKYNPTASFNHFKLYIQSADRRPLAFLSFLLNDIDWPSNNPSSFLFTNLMLHLASGLILIWLAFKVALLLELPFKEAQWIAVLTGLFWLIHPLMVSTTLYIVQRMTIIATLFTFASLLSYAQGRLLIQTNNDKKGYLWLSLGVTLFAFIAITGKEIAALIPCFLFLFETILFKQRISDILFLRWKFLFVYVPVLITIAFFLYLPNTHFWLTYTARDFNLSERLLTESRVLLYYLYLLIVPKSQTFGLHYENIELSTGFLNPITTLLSVIVILSLIIGSIRYRKKQPILAFAILFFFVGHLLESTVIPLEIYFEHRNYLPSSFLFFALAYYLVKFYKQQKILVIAISSILLATYSGLTYSRASLWGDPLLLMSVWTDINPGSVRNYTEASLVSTQFGRKDLAIQFIEKGMIALPDDPYINLWYLLNNCNNEKYSEKDFNNLLEVIKTTKKIKTVYVFKNLKLLINQYSKGKCSSLSYKQLAHLFNNALKNPNIIYAIRRSEIHHLLGRLNLVEKKYPEALQEFTKSIQEFPISGTALLQTALLASSKEYPIALKHIRYTYRLLAQNNLISNTDRNNFEDLEQRIKRAIQKEKTVNVL